MIIIRNDERVSDILVDICPLPYVAVEIESPQHVDAELQDVIIVSDIGSIPSYEGEYEITPSEGMQMLPTAGTRLENNIVIDPIPSNYGRITWDGSNITIT